MKGIFSENKGQNIQELRRNDLFLRCAYDDAGRLCYKFERVDDVVTEYGYSFDSSGHLTRVTRNGTLYEEYRYNQAGQRIAQHRATTFGMPLEAEALRYDAQGRLTSAGDAGFAYDGQGALAGRYTQRGVTAFSYGQDTRLDMAVLPTKAQIRYEYEGIHPVRRYRYLTLTGEYTWQDNRLVAFLNHDLHLEYTFRYTDSGVPGVVVLDTVTLRPLPASRRQKLPKDTDWAKECADWLPSMSAESQRQRLWAWLESWHQVTASNPLTLYAGCDQVGTLRVLTDTFGRVVKDVRRDSFGVLLEDSFPDLFMPLGFAGGLEDPDTGLVRFGWRDYDPTLGRFTAPDPAKDRRGDGDIYDYCVDDPVSRVDRTGLAWSQAAAMAGGKSHGGISHPFGGPHGQSSSGGESITSKGGAPTSRGGGKNMTSTGGSGSSSSSSGSSAGSKGDSITSKPPASDGKKSSGDSTPSARGESVSNSGGSHTSTPAALAAARQKDAQAQAETSPAQVGSATSRQETAPSGDGAYTPVAAHIPGGSTEGIAAAVKKNSKTSRSAMAEREEVNTPPKELPPATPEQNGNALPKWNREKTIEHLRSKALPEYSGNCAVYVRQAIEAGGTRLNRGLNSTSEGSAYGYGPILEAAGFKPIPPWRRPARRGCRSYSADSWP